MKRITIYYSFIILASMTLVGFLNVHQTADLISAMLFAPLALYFTLLVIPKQGKPLLVPITEKKPIRESQGRPAKKGEKDVLLNVAQGSEVLEGTVAPKNLDIDRRMFLKLIGSAGIGLFFFTIFSKKAEAAFFGSVPGTGTIAIKDTTGAKIDPAISTPTDGYKISQIDDSSSPAYFGFVEKTGKWFIMKEDSSGNYRYAKGDTTFSTNWTNRASLTYDYFDAVF